MPTRSSPHPNRLDTPDTPAIRFTRALNFGAYEFTIATACRFARLPCRIRPGLLPAHRRLLLPGFRRVGTLPAAGYDYDIDWTPMSAGLAPAGIAASIAALARIERSEIRGPLWAEAPRITGPQSGAPSIRATNWAAGRSARLLCWLKRRLQTISPASCALGAGATGAAAPQYRTRSAGRVGPPWAKCGNSDELPRRPTTQFRCKLDCDRLANKSRPGMEDATAGVHRESGRPLAARAQQPTNVPVDRLSPGPLEEWRENFNAFYRGSQWMTPFDDPKPVHGRKRFGCGVIKPPIANPDHQILKRSQFTAGPKAPRLPS
jgi:hypothetical protein